MKSILLHPVYFGPIDYFCALYKSAQIVWEINDNYQKQTYRTRQYIYGANGRLLLNIPIVHPQNRKEMSAYLKTKIDNREKWQRIHWKSMESAYQSSPFFEFYADDLKPLFQEPYDSLFQFNYSCIQTVMECLAIDKPQTQTVVYKTVYSPEKQITDLRELTAAKRPAFTPLNPYHQVFDHKHGFLPNLSILDLLFNLGPETSSFLKKISF